MYAQENWYNSLFETWLKNFHRINFPSYTLYRTNRQNGEHGGVAIAVHKRLIHTNIPSLNTKIIETTGINVNTSTGDITIISAYFPGSDLSSQSINLFKNDIKTLTSICNSYFICGDLNAKLWNNTRGNSAGNILYTELTRRPFNVHHTMTITYFPPQAGRQ